MICISRAFFTKRRKRAREVSNWAFASLQSHAKHKHLYARLCSDGRHAEAEAKIPLSWRSFDRAGLRPTIASKSHARKAVMESSPPPTSSRNHFFSNLNLSSRNWRRLLK